MKNVFLVVGLLVGSAGLGSAQTSVLNIPALPQGVSAPPAPTPTTPKPVNPVVPATDLPTVTTLPTGKTPLAAQYSVALSGPSSVKAGEANTWSFNLTNNGPSPLHLEYGACDVRFEVLNAAGQVVRPDPKNSICTMQLVILDAATGETQEVQKIRWEGKDSSGQPVPAGTYTIRAKMIDGDMFTVPATIQVTVN